MKELELISLRNLIPLIASISSLNELKKFIEDKMMPLFQFEHYLLLSHIDSDNHFVILQSSTGNSKTPETVDRKEIEAFVKANIPSGHHPTIFALKPPKDAAKSPHPYFDIAYKAGMREALLMPASQHKSGIHWILFSSKTAFFNPHKQELFDILSTIVQIALEKCIALAGSSAGGNSVAVLPTAALHTEQEGENNSPQLQSVSIIGDGAEMTAVKNLISQAAPTDSTVLILGETGTGKELIAKAIHQHSGRSQQSMITINCAALPAELIESELFGHEKGSFTGATDKKLGRFELAHNSSIFLDEIGELPMPLQAKLLRVLQERVIERLGGQKSIHVNVRIIAATNRNLQEEVVAGRFRSDLYYRLNVFPILLPSLRERPYDLKALTHFFVDKFSKKFERDITDISQQAWHALHQYNWPGNIRELEHTIERSLLLNQGKILKQIHFVSQTTPVTPTVNDGKCTLTLKEMEREYILKAIKQCNGRVSGKQGAATLLDVPATTLFSKMEKLGIKKSLLSSQTTAY